MVVVLTDVTGKQPGRREDGTFLPGSEAAKEAGHKGGEAHAAAVARGKD